MERERETEADKEERKRTDTNRKTETQDGKCAHRSAHSHTSRKGIRYQTSPIPNPPFPTTHPPSTTPVPPYSTILRITHPFCSQSLLLTWRKSGKTDHDKKCFRH